jgi:ABC-2 type transport system permease protein
MAKTWLIARYEYGRNVFQKKFILAMMSVPLMIALMLAVAAFSANSGKSSDAVGYVDHAGLLTEPLPAPQRGGSPDSPSVDKLLPLLPFQTEEAARAALEAKDIQVYYVIAPDYYQSNRVDLVYIEPPGGNVGRQFWDFMQINRMADLPPEVASRATADSNVIVYWLDDDGSYGREFSQDSFLNILLPTLIGLSFLIMLFSTSGYLMNAVVEEKENRTMEIVMTSLSSNQLIAGKVLGIMGVTLTQLLGWAFFAVLGVIIGGRYLNIALLQNVSVDLKVLATMGVIAVPSFVMVAALMTAVGATVAEAQEAQQVAGLFMFPFMIPMWLAGVIIENPGSPLAIGLSLFPMTSVSTYSLALTFLPVPTWQIVASTVIASASALGALWLAARAFRIGMLRYGQRLSWRELVGKGRRRSASVK